MITVTTHLRVLVVMKTSNFPVQAAVRMESLVTLHNAASLTFSFLQCYAQENIYSEAQF